MNEKLSTPVMILSLLIFLGSLFLVSFSILIYSTLPSLNDVLDPQALCLEVFLGSICEGSTVVDGFSSVNSTSLCFSAAFFASLRNFAYPISS